jgi:hypothetical protein
MIMRRSVDRLLSPPRVPIARAVGIALALVVGLAVGAPSTACAAASRQEVFATPEAAVDALVAAAKADDEKRLLAIFGAEAKPLLDSGDPVADEATRQRFVAQYDEAHEIVPSTGEAKVLQTGKSGWPFPIPLVPVEGGWRFDTAAGKDEILDRRIGANELSTIQTCLAYVDAQREYHARNPEGDALPQYAQRVSSSAGKRDGLYWETKPDEPPSPLGELFAEARGEGYRPKEGAPIPYHGYYYRILKAQGPSAAGGAYDYVVRGKMIGGFALVAYPAEWGASGVMTFVVNHDGVVYEKDLGPKTAKLAQSMKAFDPDPTWTRVSQDPTAAPATAS